MENKLINREGKLIKLKHDKDAIFKLIHDLTKDLYNDSSSDYYYFFDFIFTQNVDIAIEYVRNDNSLIDTLLILWINLHNEDIKLNA